MATYKVLQDVEAEDKLIGPLTLRQFIYAIVTAGLIWLSVILVGSGAAFMLIVLAPPILLLGFLAVPWHSDQPTEVWALAKIRFLLKPRIRIWDQSGAKQLVTITAPKVLQRVYSNNLSQREVRNRLHALANTIDSRGWAVKNVNVNMSAMGQGYAESDRLVEASTIAQGMNNLDIQAADDMLDASANPIAQHFDSLMTSAAATHRQELLDQLKQPAQTTAAMPTPSTANPAQQQDAPADYWFMHQPAPSTIPGQATFQTSTVVAPGQSVAPQPVNPSSDEEALAAQLRATAQQTVATDHMKHIKTPEELAEEARQQAAVEAAERAQKAAAEAQKAQVTSEKRAAIMNLASNDDLDVATIARQVNRKPQSDDGEVVISLR